MSINYNYNVIEAVAAIGGRGGAGGRGGVTPLTIDYMIVGGGGAGGVNGGIGGYTGGGAGGFRTGSLTLGLNDLFTIEVGQGGIPSGRLSSGSAFRGTNIDLFVSGGIAGGESGWPQSNTVGTTDSCGAGRTLGGGGGGGMSVGYNGNCLTPAAGFGGDAIAWYSSSFAGGGGGGVFYEAGVVGGGGGTSVSGSSGGQGGSITNFSSAGRPFSGGGGGAAGNNNGSVASEGASGSVVIRYPYVDSDFGVPYAVGGIKYVYDGYVYHRFESNGTFQTFAS